ncbi:helix-turn-helix domain-containing protein [Micromonospora sp. SL4-19]|uniref:helix-turn-helix domain-containing protein n=1 Tax=Micromonospora sp. SL4-19 TaxID=3399129 RepID=UPI003A4DC32B
MPTELSAEVPMETKASWSDPFIERVGQEVRRRRQEAGMTMQQLADASGVSVRMLSHIELGEANPSLVTVAKVAHALGTDFASLARETRPGSLVVNAPGTATGIWSSAAGSHAVLSTASTLRPSAALWDWILVPGDSYQAEPDPHGSEELFLVISGVLTLIADGHDDTVLDTGASARLATDRDYGYRNDGSEPVRFIRVTHVTA